MSNTTLIAALWVGVSLVTAGCPGDSGPGTEAVLETGTADVYDAGGAAVEPDTGPAVVPDVGASEPDVGPDPAVPIEFVACQENADCDSGWCVETADGRTCTRTCIDSCPGGWFCGPVSNTGTDVTYICLPRFVTLCKPCGTDEDCVASQGGGADKCLSYGAEGSFCGAACVEGECPGGYACEAGQCRLSEGLCDCSWKAVKDAAKTSCSVANELGTCGGSRGCLDGTLSACDAPTPAAEVCDAQDNDCDGLVDEELQLGECSESNDFGTCTGVLACEEGGLVCTAKVPEPEVCDTLDNDCDGLADEEFADTNQDGVADCVSEDDDGDGVPDTLDNCPLLANGAQEDLDVDGIGDVCDPDMDGDSDPNDSDCAPMDKLVGALAAEICDGIDNDCDNAIDEGHPDLDGDGVADCVDSDDDGDGVADTLDNCKVTPNAGQNDTDGDGVGDACEEDTDGDGDPDLTDCEPLDLLVHHGQTEQCNGVDENCNGIVDEGYPDTDNDGVADCKDSDDDGDGVLDELDVCPLVSDAAQLDSDGDGVGDACDTDDDNDGSPDVLDCAPLDPAVNPQAEEVCNQKDDDCDGQVDEDGAQGCEEYLFDNDSDGFGIAGLTKCLCGAAAPYTSQTPGDCNDQNGQVFPGASEVCNGADDDCDEAVDEGAAVGCQDAFVDGDKDGIGAGEAACVCPGKPGYSAFGGDCDDTDPTVKPGATELCNAVDDDCDDLVDEKDAVGCQSYWFDKDQDQFGVSGQLQCLCAPTGDYTAPVGGDCDDADPNRYPTNAEVCDAVDNNCNGQVDEGVKTTFFVDEDGDGFGASYSTLAACEMPAGHAAKGGDCNDFNAGIFPGASEVCNDIDDNCNGQTDEGIDTLTLYKDNDGDSFAAKNAETWQKCNVPQGWTEVQDSNGDGVNDWDCDDSDVTVFPFGPTICGDGKDNNCDGLVDRLCFSPCAGSWPFQPTYTLGAPIVSALDVEGDGDWEVSVSHNFGQAILTIDGAALYDYSAPVHNYARGLPVFADVDTYDSHGAAPQTLEILTGNGSRPRIYTVNQDGTVTITVNNDVAVYDASFFLVSDIDFDGQPEFVASTWCDAESTRFFRYDRAADQIDLISAITEPVSACEYWNKRLLTDLDGDGIAEYLYGSGYPQAYTPSAWSGPLFADRFADLGGLTTEPFCAGCFDTTIADVFGGATTNVTRFGDEIRAQTTYFQTNDPSISNPGFNKGWAYDLAGQPKDGAPGAPSLYWADMTDVDADGTPESFNDVLRHGLFDVDGDGFPDRITASGGQLQVALWDPADKTFVTSPGSTYKVTGQSLGFGQAWDMDSDGRLEVLTSSDDGKVYCHKLGVDTWHPYSSLPPYQTQAYRTGQWDNYEPNDGADTDLDGIPDHATRIPSALTRRGDFYSYLSTPTDEDFLVLDTGWGGGFCMRSPAGHNYSISVWSYADRIDNDTLAAGPDGKPDGLIWEDLSGAQTKCFSGGLLVPTRHGEYRFVVKIASADGTYSPYWPYWISAPK